MELGKQEVIHKTSELLIMEVNQSGKYIPGREGTIISIGCYSECWDESGRDITKELIAYFLKKGNPVQFATKRYVSALSIDSLHCLISWEGQLCVFISSVSISKWETIERGTDNPYKRFESFLLIKRLGIPTYLYLKPVLRNVTIKDIDLYAEVVERYGVSGVIVGSHFIEFSSSKMDTFAPIADGLLVYNTNDDETQIATTLAEISTVYKESTAPIEEWRQNAKRKS